MEMKILERPNGSRAGFSSLRNIGYDLYEVNLEGEVYKYGMRYKAERVGSNKWKIHKCDDSFNRIECVMQTDVLVGCAWYNVDEFLWENSIYADTIRKCKEFFSISPFDIQKTNYKTSRGFYYYVTRFGEVWNTETMTKIKGRVYGNGYRYLKLGSVPNIAMHRLVAHHFVAIPEDLSVQGLTEETLVVNHLDGNKLNNNWDNLEWTTNAGNLEHAFINGLMHITIDDQLLEHIFHRLQEGYSDTNISRETGISSQAVSQIRRGVSRRYRTDKYTWSKRSVDVREKELRDELAIKCVTLFNQGMSCQAIADKLGFNSKQPVVTLIGKYRDLITRKLPPRQDQRTKLDRDTIFSIYDEFYTDKKNCELSRQYNVSYQYIYALRVGRLHSKLACEYINSKRLDRYWKGFSPPK